jgi:heptosyltransferase-2
LGGPNEIEKNEKIISLNDTKRVANVGCNHSLMEFSAIINECDVIVCGDTLALHIATALNVPSVICFGPTSFHEIYDYEGLVKKVFSYDLTCLSCYNGGCQKKVTCMDMISLDEIKESVEMQLMNEKTVI